MATDKFTPEAREALGRCYRLLLRLARSEQRQATSSSIPHSQPLDDLHDGVSSSGKDTIENEAA